MFHVPKNLVTVRCGKLNPGSFLMIDLRIDERLIVPTLVLHRTDGEEQEAPARFELYGIGARVINCPLNFHQDVFEGNPRDVHFEDNPSDEEIPDYQKFFSEIAFARSIKGVTLVVDLLDDAVTPFLCEVVITFKASRNKIEALFTQGDEGVEWTPRYLMSY